MGKHRDKDQEQIQGDGVQTGRQIPKEEKPTGGKDSGGGKGGGGKK